MIQNIAKCRILHFRDEKKFGIFVILKKIIRTVNLERIFGKYIKGKNRVDSARFVILLQQDKPEMDPSRA